MPSEIGNQSVRGAGGAAPAAGADVHAGGPSQLIVVTFADADQAEGLYEELVKLDKQKVVNLEDAVFVTKGEDGKFKVHEKVHHEKRKGMEKGAVFGLLIGMMLGGPVVGLAGGALVGRMIGKRMDLGVDAGTIKSVGDDLEMGHTALFILGSSKHQPTVIEAFKHYDGKIVQSTLDKDAQGRLQKALDSHNEETPAAS